MLDAIAALYSLFYYMRKQLRNNIYFHFFITLIGEKTFTVRRLFNFSFKNRDFLHLAYYKLSNRFLLRVKSLRKKQSTYVRVNFVFRDVFGLLLGERISARLRTHLS